MVRLVFICLLFCALTAPCQSSPALYQPMVVDGFRVYPDAEKDMVFYYPPAEIRLQQNGNEPLFTFQRFRYIGTSQLGDSGKFWTRGIISFAVEFIAPAGRLIMIEQGLKRKGISRPVLLPLPVENIQSTLIYSLPAAETDATGSIEGGEWQDDTVATGQDWTTKSFSIELDSWSTDLLWQAYKRGAVVLSLGVNVVATGVDFRKRRGGPEPGKQSATVFADTLAVTVPFDAHRRLFTTTDIDVKMPAGYTYLTVTCHDFDEDYDTNHVRVMVEVMGTAVNGDRPVERVEFSINDGSTTRRQIHFKFAMNLDAGYSYRITRINRFGELEQGDWIEEKDWSGSLDVSLGEHGAIRNIQKLDIRQLY
jgi:hypothetical protein